jgi:hypothetical protein
MALIRMVEAAPAPGAVSAYGRLVLAASIGRRVAARQSARGKQLRQVPGKASNERVCVPKPSCGRRKSWIC